MPSDSTIGNKIVEILQLYSGHLSLPAKLVRRVCLTSLPKLGLQQHRYIGSPIICE